MSTAYDKVAAWLESEGYRVRRPEENKGYNFVAERGGEKLAILVKDYKTKVGAAPVQQFEQYLELEAARHFTAGWLLSTTGFSKPALTHVATAEPERLRLGSFGDHGVHWDYPPGLSPAANAPAIATPEPPPRLRYFGVFTCKGGVGKTTVAAHLAGAFALMGFDVVLIDLDPDQNLRKLFLQPDPENDGKDEDACLYLPGKRGEVGRTITVLNHHEWDEQKYPEIKIVVCDCSPVLSENPRDLVSKFDYCIVPTTLNPLGVAKRADVLIRTFEHLRALNPRAEMFALINAYDANPDYRQRNELLLELLQKSIGQYTSRDPKCKFIHPDHARIRQSAALFFWGTHIIQNKPPELAFREIAGRSHPRDDFLRLVDYLERHTDIDRLKD